MNKKLILIIVILLVGIFIISNNNLSKNSKNKEKGEATKQNIQKQIFKVCRMASREFAIVE